MFSRIQILVAGLKVFDKGYSTADHVKKIIRSLPKQWRPMAIALKLAKDLNKISMEELISSLRSHEIELEADKPQKQGKPLALKSNIKSDSKFCRLWKKPLMGPHQKKMNCLSSPEGARQKRKSEAF